MQIHNYIPLKLLGILAVWLFLIRGCLVENKSGLTSWKISGNLSSKNDALFNLQNDQLKIGGFFYNSNTYDPNLEDIKPGAGSAVFQSDSTFQLAINTESKEANVIHLIAWLDLNEDGELDTDTEPYSHVLEQAYFGGTPMFYIFSEAENSWVLGYNSNKAADISSLKLLIVNNLDNSPVTWTLQGKVMSEEGDSIALGSGKVSLGAFPSTSVAYLPAEEDIMPEAGFTKPATKGDFSLTINVTEIRENYISIFIWYDRDGDKKLDPESEQFKRVHFPGAEPLIYVRDRNNGKWADASRQRIAVNRKDIKLIATGSVLDLLDSWRIKGTLETRVPFGTNFSDGNIKVGAFFYDAPPFSPAGNGLNPQAGAVSVEPSGSFDLTVDASSVKAGYLQLFAWFDANGDNLLDVTLEPFSELTVEGDAKLMAYRYDTSNKTWWYSIKNEPAGDISEVLLTIHANLLSARHSWQLKGRLKPAGEGELSLDSKNIYIGAFYRSQNSMLLNQNDLEPLAGKAPVDADSTVTLSVDAEKTNGGYLYLIAWYDIDGDGKLDALAEPFGSLLDSTGTLAWQYEYDNRDGEWADKRQETARSLSNLIFKISVQLIPIREKWSLSGKVLAAEGRLLDIAGGKIKLGAFFNNAEKFHPSTDNITPLAGSAGVKKDDSSYVFQIDVSKSDSNKVYVAAWCDRDEDGLLDALQEPYTQPIIEIRGTNYHLAYYFPETAKQWQGPAGSRVNEKTSYNLVVQKNLIQLKTTWHLSGNIHSYNNDKVLDYWDEKMMLGAFSSTNAEFLSGLEKRVPILGSTAVKKDGSYSLSIEQDEDTKAYMLLIAWHDRDGDGNLDAKTEPYAQAVTDKTGNDYFKYFYSMEDYIWVLDQKKNISAADSSNLSLFMNNHIPSLEWHISGKADPLPGNTFDLTGTKIRLGAFYSNAKGFNFLLENNQPEGGRTSIKADSSFTLNIKATDLSFKFLFLIIWYDTDGDQKLDALTENYALVKNDKFFNTQEVYYTSEIGKTKLTYWRNGQIDRPASQDSTLIIVPSGDISLK